VLSIYIHFDTHLRLQKIYNFSQSDVILNYLTS